MLGRNSITPPTSDAAMRARSAAGRRRAVEPDRQQLPGQPRERGSPVTAPPAGNRATAAADGQPDARRRRAPVVDASALDAYRHRSRNPLSILRRADIRCGPFRRPHRRNLALAVR